MSISCHFKKCDTGALGDVPYNNPIYKKFYSISFHYEEAILVATVNVLETMDVVTFDFGIRLFSDRHCTS